MTLNTSGKIPAVLFLAAAVLGLAAESNEPFGFMTFMAIFAALSYVFFAHSLWGEEVEDSLPARVLRPGFMKLLIGSHAYGAIYYGAFFFEPFNILESLAAGIAWWIILNGGIPKRRQEIGAVAGSSA